MNRFMIGQFGKYDKQKQQRDFRKNFYGVEVCSMEREEDIDKLVEDSRKIIDARFYLNIGLI